MEVTAKAAFWQRGSGLSTEVGKADQCCPCSSDPLAAVFSPVTRLQVVSMGQDFVGFAYTPSDQKCIFFLSL